MTTLFANGAIATMDRAQPRADAMLVHDGRIALVGSEADLRTLAPDAERVDLGGRFVCPGFVDAHNHFSLTALAPLSVDCRTPPVRSLDDLLERIRTLAATVPPGRWLRGAGYDDAALGRHPTRADLDAVAPDHPVVLVHWTVHRCVANTAALRATGFLEAAADAPGGWAVRDAAGALTGLLYERATDPVQAASLRDYADRYADRLPALFRQNALLHLRHGITAVGDAYVHPALHRVYDAADLPIAALRFCGSGDGLFAPPWACVAPGGEGIKIFLDGGGNTTSASLASGRPPRFLFYAQPELERIVAAAHGAGLAIAIHAAGDGAVSMALDAFAHARRAYPNLPPRFRIEHAITVKQRDIARLRDLDVIVVTQPAAVFHAGDRLAGAPLAAGVRVAPFRDMLDAGVTLAFSSDSPCYELPPLFQMWCAVTRRTAGGALSDGQGVTVDEALHASTAAGAAALFREDDGVLRPGARPTFVVLSADPRSTPVQRWSQIRVEATYVDGVAIGTDEPAGVPPPGRPLPKW